MGEPSSFNYNTDDFVEIEDEVFEDENGEKIWVGKEKKTDHHVRIYGVRKDLHK